MKGRQFSKTFLFLTLAGGILAVATPAKAQLHIGIGINFGPPQPIVEVIPARPYPDAVWIAGYYSWHPHRHRYVWRRGYWTHAPHAHAVWTPGRWEHRHNEWVYYEGGWKKNKPQQHPVTKGRVRRH